MTTPLALVDALRVWTDRLAAAGVEQPALDARLLAADALGRDAKGLVLFGPSALSAAQAAQIDDRVARRAAGEPTARILGRREFWSLSFALTPATLDPRPDSETLVDCVLAALPDRAAPLTLADLGTGSGCLLLALLSELPAAQGIGVDRAPEAAVAARANATTLGLSHRAFPGRRLVRGVGGSQSRRAGLQPPLHPQRRHRRFGARSAGLGSAVGVGRRRRRARLLSRARRRRRPGAAPGGTAGV